MTSKVLDLTTVGHALNELCDAFLGESRWEGINESQQEFLRWYAAHRDEIRKLDSLEALADTDYHELNRFLVAHGFDPMFEKFDGIGVASILDMLVQWATEATVTTLNHYGPSRAKDFYGSRQRDWIAYPAFEIGAEGVDIYDAAGFAEPLVRLHTKTGHGLWLMKGSEPTSGLELNRIAESLLTTVERRPSFSHRLGVIVPMLDMDLDADLSWMLGITAIPPVQEKHVIQQVFQKFKLRANEKGARVKVATGIVVASAACGPIESPYVFDEPFLGFFTQPGNDTLPLAALWADTDVWRKPTGTLEEL